MAAFPTEIALKARATAKLTFTAIQKLERQKYWALALLLFLVIISFIGLLFQFALQQDGPALFSNGMYTLTSLVGASWSLRAAYQASRGPVVLCTRYRLAWTFIGLGLLANGLGNIYYGVFQYLTKTEPPLPSYADIGYTLFYIFSLTGLLLLPVQTKRKRLGFHIVIDSSITVLCLLGISWYMVIKSIFIQAKSGALFQTIMAISYPCWDVLLILALILFIRQRITPVLQPTIWLYSLGILAQVWADSSYAYLTNYNLYHSGTVAVDPFWFIGYLLIGIAPLYQYNAIARLAYTNSALAPKNPNKGITQPKDNLKFEGRFVLLQSTMIYIPFIVLLLITLWAQFVPNHGTTHFLDVLFAIVFSLLITHYVLATYENARLVHEKELSRSAAELLRKSTASLSSVLEMDLLLNHIVIIGAAELGFDTAALVLIEEYDRPLSEQTSLLARATTADATNVMSWHVTGAKIPYCLALMGKELEVHWRDAPAHAPTLVHQWHMDQSVQSSLFVPLAYQGKIQGSLAFSIRDLRHFSEHEYYLARAFAEEAANAIEHAHLYELARENALFAQAMSNVAARLNSVVATGMGLGNEIHHLICTEGANALRADLAILYVHHHDNQFVPLAAIASDSEPQTLPQEWPPIAVQDYNAFLHSAQPNLLQVAKPAPDGLAGNWYHAGIMGPQSQPAARPLPRLTQSDEYPNTMRSVSTPLHATHATLVAPKPQQRQPLTTLQEALQRRYASTAILAPLIIHQAPMGLLVLARSHRPGIQETRAFALPDLELARDFAGQAAIAFTNAHLYQQLHNAHHRMQELDQLKDQFMVTASHELRTPLTAVQGYLELLENYHTTLSSEQQQEFLEKASHGCEELILLLNNVMDASRLEVEAGIRPAHLERISLREVVESIVDLIFLQATQEHREIRVNISSHLMVKADPTRLRQVIRNLSVNALKYSPPGTPLSFSARPIFAQGACVILNVTDYGKGIKPADQARLFQRFVRLESDLNSVVRGSGLGLYISRRLVEAMNGRIWIESNGTPGDGTTFSIQLPMA
ncbi:MAG TPA: GAF domain-containing sensor histidine kinase [Ktedonobacteraceae bacterium]